MRTERVVIIGAGVGGLVAALRLASQGLDVTVIETAATPGGKMRQIGVGGAAIDGGPTVFTMRWVFDQIFADAGTSLAEHLSLKPVDILARHAWSGGETLDLFADIDRSADAIGDLAGEAEARGYRQFCARARGIYETLEHSFIRADRPGPIALVRRAGLSGLGDLWRISPFETMWEALGQYFGDPRLRQLFGRYATYCGSSPFLAPATLMLVAHVESEGVWLVEGGMHRIARALAELAATKGASFRYGTAATEILTENGRVSGVRLANGERIAADAVVVNADTAAIATGLLGSGIARAAPSAAARSLSAVTVATVARTDGFPLLRHNVFFSDDYKAEFDDIFRRNRVPAAPTVYLCAQDRDDGHRPRSGPERLFCLINAPPYGDTHSFEPAEIERCTDRIFNRLAQSGLIVDRASAASVVTTPADFNRLFPATGGALYGPATHGWNASFRRPGSRTTAPGLYLAGGSTHPGPGVPMAALSGRLAADNLLSELASSARSRRAAIHGGMSMR